MITFTAIFLFRLYFPKWKEQWHAYLGGSRRRGSYGRWAMQLIVKN